MKSRAEPATAPARGHSLQDAHVFGPRTLGALKARAS
jgi:hypothetical protein